MNIFEKLTDNGLLVALPPSTLVNELDWLEMTRTDRSGKRYRNYYRVWDFPWGQKPMQSKFSVQFHGWRNLANRTFADFAADYEFLTLPRGNDDGSLNRAQCGITRIYRMAKGL